MGSLSWQLYGDGYSKQVDQFSPLFFLHSFPSFGNWFILSSFYSICLIFWTYNRYDICLNGLSKRSNPVGAGGSRSIQSFQCDVSTWEKIQGFVDAERVRHERELATRALPSRWRLFCFLSRSSQNFVCMLWVSFVSEQDKNLLYPLMSLSRVC